MPSKAQFNTKTKEEIYERDGECCVNCGKNSQLQFHHIYFGIEANRTKNRNKSNQGVTVCMDCHNMVHSCRSGEGIRQRLINYLEKG